MPYQREPQVELAIWRDVERELESTEPGSPEAEFLQTEVARLRNDLQAVGRAGAAEGSAGAASLAGTASSVRVVSDSATRERIALHVLAMLPDGWRIGQTSWNPDVGRWAITARGPHPGRGKAQETISGTGVDDLAAITDLGVRLDERRRA